MSMPTNQLNLENRASLTRTCPSYPKCTGFLGFEYGFYEDSYRKKALWLSEDVSNACLRGP